MAAGIVQMATATSFANITNPSISLPANVTVNNGLLLFITWRGVAPTSTTLSSSGWTILQSGNYGAFAYKPQAASGDTTVTVTFSSAQYGSLELYEITGHNVSTMIYNSARQSISGTSVSTPSLTPIANCLPLGAVSQGTTSSTTLNTTGWTQDANTSPNNQALTVAHGPLTTTSAVSCSWTWGSSVSSGASWLVLVASAPFTVSPTSLSFSSPSAATQSIIASGGSTPYSYSSSNTGVATVNTSGTVTPIGQGSCTITATDANNNTATVSVTVGYPLVSAPNNLNIGFNAGAQLITVSRTGSTGTFSASSSNTNVATVSGGGTGPTQNFQVLRQTSAGGTCNITFIDSSDGTQVILPVTVYGPLTINDITAPYQTSIVVNVSEVNYSGVLSASVISGPPTVSPASGRPTSAGGIVAFTFTWPSNALGEAVVQFSDDHGDSIQAVINLGGAFVVTPQPMVFSGLGIYNAQTLNASEIGDTHNISASVSPGGIVSLTQTTNSAGAAAWTVIPLAIGNATITVLDGNGNTQLVSVFVMTSLIAFPTAINVFTNQVTPVVVTAAENLFTGTLTAIIDNTTIATVSPASGVGPTVNFAISFKGIAGSAKLTISDGTNSVVVPITVTPPVTTFAISAGIVVYNGNKYSIPGISGSLQSGQVVEYGVQIGGTPPPGVPSLPAIVELPNIQAVSTLHAKNVYASAGYKVSPVQVTKLSDFVGFPLYRLHCLSGTITGTRNEQVFGGVGQLALKASLSSNVTISGTPSIVVTPEGSTSAKVSFTATLANLTLDETVRQVAVTWAIAGSNEWTPGVPVTYNPNNLTVSGFVHPLSAGQAYDVGLLVYSQDGSLITPTPLLLSTTGSSPTVSTSAILIALNLDQINDGVNYRRLNAPSVSRWNSDGTMTSDSGWLSNQVSLWTGTTDFVFHANSPSGSTSISVWLDSGVDNSQIHYSQQNGTTAQFSCYGTSTAAGATFSGLASGATYYFLAFWSNVADNNTSPATVWGWNVWISAANTPFTYSQVAYALKDARYAYIATKSTGNNVTTGGGIMSRAGGSGGKLLN